MGKSVQTIIRQLDKVIDAREKLDKKYWAEAEKLTTRWEKLMKELEDA